VKNEFEKMVIQEKKEEIIIKEFEMKDMEEDNEKKLEQKSKVTSIDNLLS